MNRFHKFHDLHQDETMVVIGNGPSLDNVPRELLDKYPTIGTNKIFNLPFTPDYYMIVDEQMMWDCLPVLQDGWRPKQEMFVRAECGLKDNNYIYPVVVNGFSLDPANFISMCGTVTMGALQLAFWMGASPVLLVGVDHYYPKASQGEPGARFVADGEDPDHFRGSGPYFTPGQTYNRPEDTTEAYVWADDVFAQTGKEIINLTEGTHLDVFPKGTYEQWL